MDMTVDNMKQAIARARRFPAPGVWDPKNAEIGELRAIVLALDEWAGNGLRTGQELDQITTAARDYVERFAE